MPFSSVVRFLSDSESSYSAAEDCGPPALHPAKTYPVRVKLVGVRYFQSPYVYFSSAIEPDAPFRLKRTEYSF